MLVTFEVDSRLFWNQLYPEIAMCAKCLLANYTEHDVSKSRATQYHMSAYNTIERFLTFYCRSVHREFDSTAD